MKKLGKKNKKLNSVEAYACACLYVLRPSCTCTCSCTCNVPGLYNKSFTAGGNVNGSNSYDMKNFETSVVQA